MDKITGLGISQRRRQRSGGGDRYITAVALISQLNGAAGLLDKGQGVGGWRVGVEWRRGELADGT